MANATPSRGGLLKTVGALAVLACAWYFQQQQGPSTTKDAPTNVSAPSVETPARPAITPPTQAKPPVAEPPAKPVQKPAAKPVKADDGGATKVKKLFDTGTSDTVVDVYGKVDRILADDTDGDQHQKFILELRDGHTVLVAHNIDLTERVPIKAGDEVHVKGEFEYDERGGVIHWTHRDPRGKHEAGFIEHAGKRYQ